MALRSASKSEGCAHAAASTAGDLTHSRAVGKQSACQFANRMKAVATFEAIGFENRAPDRTKRSCALGANLT